MCALPFLISATHAFRAWAKYGTSHLCDLVLGLGNFRVTLDLRDESDSDTFCIRSDHASDDPRAVAVVLGVVGGIDGCVGAGGRGGKGYVQLAAARAYPTRPARSGCRYHGRSGPPAERT